MLLLFCNNNNNNNIIPSVTNFLLHRTMIDIRSSKYFIANPHTFSLFCYFPFLRFSLKVCFSTLQTIYIYTYTWVIALRTDLSGLQFRQFM
jgi:hypothetical protein